jgi:hypothetical protein
MKPLQDAKPGYPLRATDLNAQTAELQRIGKISLSNGSVVSDANGLHIQMPETKGFYARISGRNGFRYSFIQYQADHLTDSLFGYSSQKYDYGKSISGPLKSEGTLDYAEEVNLSLSVPTDTVVWLEPIYSFQENDKVGTKYLFEFGQFGGSGTPQKIITDIDSDANGILLTKHTYHAWNSNSVYSPTLMACLDVIPKSLSGQKNRVLVVNAAESGFEFGASIAPSTGIATATASIAGLNASITNIQTQITSINATLNALAASIASLGG